VLRFADPKAALCPGLTCLYKAGGRSLYFDQDHLSAAGAVYSAPALEACFEPSDARTRIDGRRRNRRAATVARGNSPEVCQGEACYAKILDPGGPQRG
jgi:SGNH domain (fused to AT3 domains)